MSALSTCRFKGVKRVIVLWEDLKDGDAATATYNCIRVLPTCVLENLGGAAVGGSNQFSLIFFKSQITLSKIIKNIEMLRRVLNFVDAMTRYVS